MSSENILDKVKKLRELTGVGFKDCKNAIDNCNGDIEKSIEFLRVKGIAKANKKMERIAADGLVCISEKENKLSSEEGSDTSKDKDEDDEVVDDSIESIPFISEPVVKKKRTRSSK